MKLRSFIAVEIPGEIQSAIQRSTASLQKNISKPTIRWVESKNLHLTLKFLGDVLPEKLKQLAEALELSLITQGSFEMSVVGLGVFPSAQRPRIIWIGLDAPVALTTLHQNVDAIASKIGFDREERPFSPHLTIGRVGDRTTQADNLKIRTSIEAVSLGNIGTVLVKEVTIFKSDLKPGGPVYSRLYTIPLKP